MADMPSFPMNRARYRELDAKMRRLSKRLDCNSGCSTAKGPAAFQKNPLLIDQLTAGTQSASLKYSGAVSAVGHALSMPQFEKAYKDRELPTLLRRVTTLSGLIGLYVTDQPREKWRDTLAQVTSFKIADQTMAFSKMMKLSDEESIPAALTLVLLQGALAHQIGEKNDLSIGYRRAMQLFDSSIGSLQREAVRDSASKLNGLGLIAANPFFNVTVLAQGPLTPLELYEKLNFAEIPSDIPGNVTPADVISFAVTLINNNDSQQALTDWSKAAPAWIDAAKRNAFRLAAFGVGRLPLLKANRPVDPVKVKRKFDQLASEPGNLNLQTHSEWAVRPPEWDSKTRDELVGASLANLLIGYQKFRGLNLCNEALKDSAEWITEPCAAFNTGLARAAKIDLVYRAWKKAFPDRGNPDNCTINYYTQFKWCDVDTLAGEMKVKESVGRPVPKQEEKERGDGPFLKWIKENLGPAIDWIIVKLKELAAKASELLCKAFKAIFPDPVGGVLCRIFEVILGTVTAVITTVLGILKTVLIGLGKFFVAIFGGDIKGAALALVQMINTCVVMLLGGLFQDQLGVALVEAELTPDQKAAGMISLEGLGEKLPGTFTLTLIFSVLGVIFGGPTPVAISALITCLSPAVALIAVPALKRNIPSLKDAPNDKLALGTETVVKIVGMVVGFVLNMSDVFEKFSSAMKRYWERLKAKPGDELTKLGKGFADNFAKKWNDLSAACKGGNLRSISDGIKGFFSFFPDLLVALGDPDITDIAEQGKKLVAGTMSIYAQAQATWDQAMASYKTDVEKMDALKKQIEDFQKQLDVLCAIPANKSQPACQKPAPKETIVYVDSKGGTATVNVKPQTPAPVPVPTTGTGTSGQRPPYTPAKAPAKKGGAGAALALATGGFFVAGPVGAAAGLVIGLAAGK